MIGVICSDSDLIAAEEFFQLFKTPWQRLQEGKRYDVVVSTEDRVPDVAPGLLVSYGSRGREIDSRLGVLDLCPAGNSAWRYGEFDLPIYGDGVAFSPGATRRSVVRSEAGTTGYETDAEGKAKILRLGYDLFREVDLLLTGGQTVQWAHVPTMEIHIRLLRDAIISSGASLLEVPPAPAGRRFSICITHDIDFVGIRQHKFDHTMWGFLYRSTLGGLRDCLRGRISVARMLRMWWAVLLLPFVYLGFAKDYWLPFEWYLRVEKGLPTTYFFIPYKHRAGQGDGGQVHERRATQYDVTDIPEWIAILAGEGCEIAVHGIDAWHDVDSGRAEMSRVAAVAQTPVAGIRMHWLLQSPQSLEILRAAGYRYDSTAGYNETVGYRLGTTQVCRPSGGKGLPELPLHIQDGALFYPGKLGLTEPEAWRACEGLIGNAQEWGGVLTVLWHDRSHGPERFWGDFYVKLLDKLRHADAWFATGSQVVDWFERRRGIEFVETVSADGGLEIVVTCRDGATEPGFNLRIWRASADGSAEPSMSFDDSSWSGLAPVRYSTTRAAEWID